MGESDTELFQDRTPRPSINFNKMNNNQPFVIKDKGSWIEHYSQCAMNRIDNNINTSWQDHFTKKIQEISIEYFLRNTSIEEFREKKLTQQLNDVNIN
jgi:hypothetical protein